MGNARGQLRASNRSVLDPHFVLQVQPHPVDRSRMGVQRHLRLFQKNIRVRQMGILVQKRLTGG
jgi:hypothetical protein